MMNQSFNQKPYASGRVRALLTIVLLGACAACGALSLIVNAVLIGMLRNAGDQSTVYEFGESVTELLYVGVALLQVLVFIATAAAFLMWMHRAYRNLPALGARRLDTTPGWAVGYFFIPFANLVKPFQVVREIWHGSTPRGGGSSFDGRDNFGGFPSSGTPALIGWWWAFWIIANVAGRASSRATDMAATIGGMVLASWATIASDALFIVAALLAILVLKRIDDMQEAKFRESGTQWPPPPPESFETPRVV
ncbi:MAG: hypothetical protein QOD32_1299 [Pyrinomonadaceae bacterium]|jgi:hypothetical protein|nr:hypothetical protein [Pyrinomonadaceae bacterium]